MTAIQNRKNIALIGMMGAGKTTIGSVLAHKLNMVFVDLDKIIENQSSLTISKIFELHGETYFRKLEKELIKKISNKPNQVISTGGGVVKDIENINLLKNSSLLLYLSATPEALYQRIKDEVHRPLLYVKDPIQTLKDVLKEREDNYRKAHHQIDTMNKTSNKIVDEVITIYEKING